jgi:hypothetical protein
MRFNVDGRVARLAVEVLRLAQQGDAQSVLDIVAPSSPYPSNGSYGVDRVNRDFGKMTLKDHKVLRDIKFSTYITAVHQARDGISIEQVPTGLRDGFAPETQGRKDALRLRAYFAELLLAQSRNLLYA